MDHAHEAEADDADVDHDESFEPAKYAKGRERKARSNKNRR
jgi:hypothetical protein